MSEIARVLDARRIVLQGPTPVLGRDGKVLYSSESRFVDAINDSGFTRYRSVLPREFQEFLDYSNGVRLFEDVDYGQWGLKILGFPDFVLDSLYLQLFRRGGMVIGDLVIGEFLGDSDLLVLRADASADDFGSVLIARVMGGRESWCSAGATFKDFLIRYLEAEGKKFWVR